MKVPKSFIIYNVNSSHSEGNGRQEVSVKGTRKKV